MWCWVLILTFQINIYRLVTQESKKWHSDKQRFRKRILGFYLVFQILQYVMNACQSQLHPPEEKSALTSELSVGSIICQSMDRADLLGGESVLWWITYNSLCTAGPSEIPDIGQKILSLWLNHFIHSFRSQTAILWYNRESRCKWL